MAEADDESGKRLLTQGVRQVALASIYRQRRYSGYFTTQRSVGLLTRCTFLPALTAVKSNTTRTARFA